MNQEQPLVSVLTPCYNQSAFVCEALESIRNQTYQNIQLIIIDDCSTDNSVAVIQDWIARYSVKCIFVAHSQNKGVCKTLNEALSYAKGKYISMLAADDIWLLDKTENHVREMEKLPEEVGVMYSDSLTIDENGNLLPNKFIESHRDFSSMPAGNIFPTLLEGNFIPAMTTLIRRQCFHQVGMYDEELSYEDYDMWLRMSHHYKFAFSPTISAKYRIVATSLTRTVLHKPSTDNLRSSFRIFYKCLTPTKNGHAQKRFITDQLNGIAQELYRLKCKGRNVYLWKLLCCDPRPHTLGMLISSLLGISYHRFNHFVSWQAAVRRRLMRTAGNMDRVLEATSMPGSGQRP